MRCLLLSMSILFSLAVSAQCKTFRISSRGDTLDCVDMNGLKQGKWLVRVAPLRGEPGYEEEGVFVDSRKEGVWRRFNMMGDPLAVETYKWGNKNGISRYFTINGLEREEVWRAVNPDKSFDTIDVQDLKDPNRYEMVVVKNDGHSFRHGTWKYYYPNSGALIRTEKYILDRLQEPDAESVAKGMQKVSGDTTKGKTAAIPEKAKPKEVMEFEKKTSGKKKAVRTGSTGG
jgi:hypothetical protein